jgi:hypothetical protein
MKPVRFKEQNVIFAEDQPEYEPLPALRTEGGDVIFCMKLTFRERVRVLFLGNIWCSLCAFGRPLTPSFYTTKKSDLIPNS